MTALVRVRGVAVAVPRNKGDQHGARRILTEATRSPQAQLAWEEYLRDLIAQGKHVDAANDLLSALNERALLLEIARLKAQLIAA